MCPWWFLSFILPATDIPQKARPKDLQAELWGLWFVRFCFDCHSLLMNSNSSVWKSSTFSPLILAFLSVFSSRIWIQY